MAKNIEKLLKIERPRELTKLTLDTIEIIPISLTLDLTDIEPCTEPGIALNIDLDLDQLEEAEE